METIAATEPGVTEQTLPRARVQELASELDRIYARVSGAGLALKLTDASGTVLYERSEPKSAPSDPARLEVVRIIPHARQEALTLADLGGDDPRMLRNVRSAYRLIDSRVPILILGPTGSGKEAFAYAMHLASARVTKAFVAVNCAAIPETLIESELFGYKPGAFTGARREGMRGKILQSAGGTLFLDEIGDMPFPLQSRLLRVLEQQEVMPLGSETAIAVDLHVIAASHRPLREMVARGEFREDLNYRQTGITFELPALRERHDREQVIRRALASETLRGRPAAIERDALQQLLAYAWPGNIRELRNVIRTALAICDGGVVRRADLPAEIRDYAPPQALTQEAPAAHATLLPLEAAERSALIQVIEDCRGNMTRVAARLGMSRNTLYRRMKRHGIRRPISPP